MTHNLIVSIHVVSYILLWVQSILLSLFVVYSKTPGGHDGAVVTHLPPTSEVSSSNPGPNEGKLEVAY